MPVLSNVYPRHDTHVYLSQMSVIREAPQLLPDQPGAELKRLQDTASLSCNFLKCNMGTVPVLTRHSQGPWDNTWHSWREEWYKIRAQKVLVTYETIVSVLKNELAQKRVLWLYLPEEIDFCLEIWLNLFKLPKVQSLFIPWECLSLGDSS